MRLNYVPDPPQFSDPEDQAIVDRIKARRPGNKLLDLDRTLLIAPQIASGWNAFLGSIRTQPNNSLPDSIRQVAIARTVALNRAWFAWTAHHDLLLASADTKITREAIEYVLTAPPKSQHPVEDAVGGFDKRHMAIMEYVDYITKDVKVPEEVVERLKGKDLGFSERNIVEITACTCAYNCTTRFLWGLNIAGEKGIEYGSMEALPRDEKRRGNL